jgi:Zn-dependent alcohol dehydrogenase
MKGKMRSVHVTKPKDPLEIVERDIPESGARRIKVQACAICHNDSATKTKTECIFWCSSYDSSLSVAGVYVCV